MTQPTHDEVMAWIDDKLKQIEEASSVYGAPTGDGYRASLLANRAGLERHKENPENVLTQLYGYKEFYTEKHNACQTCITVAFPCPTYTDIYNPIASVM